jgi:hypothetical protein
MAAEWAVGHVCESIAEGMTSERRAIAPQVMARVAVTAGEVADRTQTPMQASRELRRSTALDVQS